ILLIDNARTEPLEELRFFLKAFEDLIQSTKVVVGITRVDISDTPKIADYQQVLATFNLNPPVFEIDARRKEDVSLLVQALLYSLDPSLKDSHKS
ncbi:MAG: GTP-binding protein, partial [Thiomargarita sp.]|nr:GTP-binding protein [Thiomargarita sp.]